MRHLAWWKMPCHPFPPHQSWTIQKCLFAWNPHTFALSTLLKGERGCKASTGGSIFLSLFCCFIEFVTKSDGGKKQNFHPSCNLTPTHIINLLAHKDLASVVQRVDNFIQWIGCYPVGKMYSNKSFWQLSFSHNPILKLDKCFYLLIPYYKAIGNSCTHFICCMATYPVDKIIRSLNNWGQTSTSGTPCPTLCD